MKVRIEVVDEDPRKVDDMIWDIACDLFDKYPKAEADMDKIEKEKTVELLVNR